MNHICLFRTDEMFMCCLAREFTFDLLQQRRLKTKDVLCSLALLFYMMYSLLPILGREPGE